MMTMIMVIIVMVMVMVIMELVSLTNNPDEKTMEHKLIYTDIDLINISIEYISL